MITKYIFLALSFLATNRRSDTTALQSAVRSEILNIGFKLLLGTIVTSAVIYSLVQLGGAFQIYLSHYENALELGVMSFSLIALLGLFLLLLIFGKSQINWPRLKKTPPPSDFQTIALKFVEGFLKGLNSPAKENKE